ncbi:DUF397 domain-containing protein [Nocardiopsis sp. NPDC049922]|uniref:DUF397 domain-containing protein n=1 Tax=Nocardiopsis sp. NPDC049922 TaxID=3155157 RepID=UPI0034005334
MSNHKVATGSPVAWHVSTYSSDGGRQCVEAGPFTDGTDRFAVRDSQHRSHGHLTFARPEWTALLAAISQA